MESASEEIDGVKGQDNTNRTDATAVRVEEHGDYKETGENIRQIATMTKVMRATMRVILMTTVVARVIVTRVMTDKVRLHCQEVTSLLNQILLMNFRCKKLRP